MPGHDVLHLAFRNLIIHSISVILAAIPSPRGMKLRTVLPISALAHLEYRDTDVEKSMRIMARFIVWRMLGLMQHTQGLKCTHSIGQEFFYLSEMYLRTW